MWPEVMSLVVMAGRVQGSLTRQRGWRHINDAYDHEFTVNIRLDSSRLGLIFCQIMRGTVLSMTGRSRISRWDMLLIKFVFRSQWLRKSSVFNRHAVVEVFETPSIMRIPGR